MTTKELFENLLAGKKMRESIWSRGAYVFINNKGDLEFHNRGTIDQFCLVGGDWNEIKGIILTDKEKEYLSAVIKPFRDEVIGIEKESCRINKEFIRIHLNLDTADLPYFEKDTMYKGMKTDRNYTLEELGL